ncbi:MAG: hypothetical protein H0Z35_02585 [Thermoanaerobacteraceae bacterium]|nr:hypothetical protein [Thermoanaerobacteraceae bacterium]
MLNRRATRINRRQPVGNKISQVAQSKRRSMEMAHAITTNLEKINRPDFKFTEGGDDKYFGGI